MNSIFTNELKNKLYSLGQAAPKGRFDKYNNQDPSLEAVSESAFTPELIEQINSLFDKRIKEVETGQVEPVSGLNTELKEASILVDAPTLLRYLDENRISFNTIRLVSKEDDTPEEVKKDYQNPSSKFKKITFEGPITYYINPEAITEYLRYIVSKIDNQTIANVFKVKIETILKTINYLTKSNISINKSKEELDREKQIQESVDIPLHLYNPSDYIHVKLAENDLKSIVDFINFLKTKKTLLNVGQNKADVLYETIKNYATTNVAAGPFLREYIRKSLEYIRGYLLAKGQSVFDPKLQETYKRLIALSGQLLGNLGSGNYTEKSTPTNEASAFTPDDKEKAKQKLENLDPPPLPFDANNLFNITKAQNFFARIIEYCKSSGRTSDANNLNAYLTRFNNELAIFRTAYGFNDNILNLTSPDTFINTNGLRAGSDVAIALISFQTIVTQVQNASNTFNSTFGGIVKDYCSKLQSNNILGERLLSNLHSYIIVANTMRRG